jgi:hypothetical protein
MKSYQYSYIFRPELCLAMPHEEEQGVTKLKYYFMYHMKSPKNSLHTSNGASSESRLCEDEMYVNVTKYCKKPVDKKLCHTALKQ